MDYTFTVPELISELEHWADARDNVNRRNAGRPDEKTGRRRKTLESDPLREASARLQEYLARHLSDHHRAGDETCRSQSPVEGIFCQLNVLHGGRHYSSEGPTLRTWR